MNAYKKGYRTIQGSIMPAPKKNQKILNKLAVLLLKGPVSVFELTHKLKISERTVYRYLKHLDDMLLNGRFIIGLGRERRACCYNKRVNRHGDRPVRYWIPN